MGKLSVTSAVAVTVLSVGGVAGVAGIASAGGSPAAPPSTEPVTSTSDETPDDETIAVVLEHFGLDEEALTCIAGGLAASTPGDDHAAVQVMQDCGLSLSEILESMVFEDVTVVSAPEPATEPSDTDDNEPPDAVMRIIEELGIPLSEEQLSCIADVIEGGVDTSDIGSVLSALDECGINITDLMG